MKRFWCLTSASYHYVEVERSYVLVNRCGHCQLKGCLDSHTWRQLRTVLVPREVYGWVSVCWNPTTCGHA